MGVKKKKKTCLKIQTSALIEILKGSSAMLEKKLNKF
jgi:hypothetical protein